MSPRLPLFQTIVEKSKAEPDFVANTLLQKFTELRRQGVAVDAVGEDRLLELFDAYARGSVTKQAVGELSQRWQSRTSRWQSWQRSSR